MSFVPLYNLEALNEQQRQDYVKAVCNHMGVPPELNLVMLTYLDENEGPRRLVAYAKRGATEIIRSNRGINVTNLDSKQIGGSLVFTATGKDNTGRQEMSTGSKYIDGLKGKELDDAIMTAQTRACRRMTLQFVGAGVLDESEVNPNAPTSIVNTTSIPVAPLPVAVPNNEPGKDATGTETNLTAVEETLEQFKERQKKLREEAIEHLNKIGEERRARESASEATTETPVEPRKKRPYNKKKNLDLGSAPVSTTAPLIPDEKEQGAVDTGHAHNPAPAVVAAPPATAKQEQDNVGNVLPFNPAPAVSKARLSPEIVKPFRQRQFKFVNELEENGFAPKEGMGNQDKMRNFASMMFPEVTNFNELTVEQWEKYLTTIETKLKAVGAVETIKYIEDAIGI